MRHPRSTLLGSWLLGLVLTSCTTAPKPTDAPKSEPGEPEAAAAMAELEARLLAARGATASCTLTSAGAIDSEIKAVLGLGASGDDKLDVVGTFAGTRYLGRLQQSGATTDVFLTADGTEPTARTVETPPEIRQALALGFTRMGLLHNVSNLVGGQLPDHSEGGVQDWIVTTNHRWQSPDVLAFELQVDGVEMATATITFDSDGWPVRRTQRVEFDEGAMEVEEQCAWTVAD